MKIKQTARFVLANNDNHCFLALHNHYLPENIGKWGTVGGIMDPGDADILACLRREWGEEFAGASVHDFEIGELLIELKANGTTHSFFAVKTRLQNLVRSQPEEVLQAAYF